MSKTRTIALTGMRPVTITLADWPKIARASGDDCTERDPALRQQALDRDQADTWFLAVRQHADGRVLVYGGYSGSVLGSGYAGPGYAGTLSGPGVDDADLVRLIEETGRALQCPYQAVADCIADLPAREI